MIKKHSYAEITFVEDKNDSLIKIDFNKLNLDVELIKEKFFIENKKTYNIFNDEISYLREIKKDKIVEVTKNSLTYYYKYQFKDRTFIRKTIYFHYILPSKLVDELIKIGLPQHIEL